METLVADVIVVSLHRTLITTIVSHTTILNYLQSTGTPPPLSSH